MPVTSSVHRKTTCNDALKVPHEKQLPLTYHSATPWCVCIPSDLNGWLAAGRLSGNRWCAGRSVCIRSVSSPVYELLLAILAILLVLGTGINTERLDNGERRSWKQQLSELVDPIHKGGSGSACKAVSGFLRAINLPIR